VLYLKRPDGCSIIVWSILKAFTNSGSEWSVSYSDNVGRRFHWNTGTYITYHTTQHHISKVSQSPLVTSMRTSTLKNSGRFNRNMKLYSRYIGLKCHDDCFLVLVVGWEWVFCTSSRWMCELIWSSSGMIIDTEILKYLVKSLFQESYFVHSKSHVDWPGLGSVLL
jgi:hypothetical protein